MEGVDMTRQILQNPSAQRLDVRMPALAVGGIGSRK
jgi:hypothetical protein